MTSLRIRDGLNRFIKNIFELPIGDILEKKKNKLPSKNFDEDMNDWVIGVKGVKGNSGV